MSRTSTCMHKPACPAANESGWPAAQVVIPPNEQGWSMLCNGVVAFDDQGALMPDGAVVAAGFERRSGAAE